MKELNKLWTQEELWNLRQQVPLCSIFVKDYVNTFHVDPGCVCDFFDGYVECLRNEMEGFEKNYNDEQFYKLLPKYDTPEILYNWWWDLEYVNMNENGHCLPCPPGRLKTSILRVGGKAWNVKVYVPYNKPKSSERK